MKIHPETLSQCSRGTAGDWSAGGHEYLRRKKLRTISSNSPFRRTCFHAIARPANRCRSKSSISRTGNSCVLKYTTLHDDSLAVVHDQDLD
jgi:hypothetical protein